MPSEHTKVPVKRKAPAFKPPRPAANAKSTAPAAPSRRKSAVTHPPIFSSSDEDEAASHDRHQIPARDIRPNSSLLDPPPTIPPKLLTTLLQHRFSDEKTRIGTDASALVGEYMDTFVKEALARAAFERSEAGAESARGGDFLQVEDLEKLAPQLILDF
ncbi:hypothetical protein MMC09_000909 [Bachmanniomyces sp. S44760]|nr:hypothetical protein [Bachmanniomyces sp. S44760]